MCQRLHLCQSICSAKKSTFGLCTGLFNKDKNRWLINSPIDGTLHIFELEILSPGSEPLLDIIKLCNLVLVSPKITFVRDICSAKIQLVDCVLAYLTKTQTNYYNKFTNRWHTTYLLAENLVSFCWTLYFIHINGI